MTEKMPNPLNNKGVQKVINDKVSTLMCRRVSIPFCEIDKYIESAINDAARWGVALGFNMGWHARELTDGTQSIRRQSK